VAKYDSQVMPPVKVMPPPPDSRIVPLEREPNLSHQQVERIRFGLGDTGPLAQAVMNSNSVGLIQCLPFGITASSGMIIIHACATTWVAPNGWLECAGAAVNKQLILNSMLLLVRRILRRLRRLRFQLLPS
jgi:hypothetical protein